MPKSLPCKTITEREQHELRRSCSLLADKLSVPRPSVRKRHDPRNCHLRIVRLDAAMRFITEDEVQEALDYLWDNAPKAAQAKANRVYMEQYLKVVKAKIMSEHNEKAVNAREQYAYCDSRYMKQLEALRQATLEDAELLFRREAAMARFEAYRTQSATERAMKL